MSKDNPGFISWEEHIICQERGNRVVHFHLKDASGDSILAVVGTERSIRHMMYVVSDEFSQVYGTLSSCIKWRTRREVVDWLNSLVSKQDSQMHDAAEILESLRVTAIGLKADATYFPDQMVPRKLKAHVSEIEWSGIAWTCAKQLNHYPAFSRNGITITAHSFVFIMAEEASPYLGYLEDMYEDKKGQKKVKVRWFHHNQEVKGVISQLNPHPREVFITPHVQVISAECIDGLATVLTPKHFEQYLSVVSNLSRVHMCYRQFKNNKVMSFAITKLRGYSNQSIVSGLERSLNSKQKCKHRKVIREDEEEFTHDDPIRLGTKRSRSSKGLQVLETGSRAMDDSQMMKSKTRYPKLKLKLSRNPTSIKVAEPQTPSPVLFGVGENIELISQDSGIRGCWFRCKIMRLFPKKLRVQHIDVEDADGRGKLKEWVPAFRVAAPDKLGMRCAGRLTTRPFPPQDSSNCIFEVGAAVDVWLCDGWWEGVLTVARLPGRSTVQVYLPGENKFEIVKKNDVRTSRDWVDNRWVNIKVKPDILSWLSANASPSMKPPICSTIKDIQGFSSITQPESKVLTRSRLETINEDEQEEPTLGAYDEPLRNVVGVDLDKGPCINRRGRIDENGTDITSHEGKFVMEEDLLTASQKLN